MSGQVFALTIIAMGLVFALIMGVLDHLTKWKSKKSLSEDEQQQLDELWQSSERLESRLSALETILDGDDRPRSKSP